MKVEINGWVELKYYCESDCKYYFKDIKDYIGILNYDNCKIELVNQYNRRQETICIVEVTAIEDFDVNSEDEMLALMGDYIVTGKFGDLENIEWDFVEEN